MTEPPLRGTFSANLTQWSMYDDYMEDIAKKAKLNEKKTVSRQKTERKKKKKTNVTESAVCCLCVALPLS